MTETPELDEFDGEEPVVIEPGPNPYDDPDVKFPEFDGSTGDTGE